MEKKFFYNLSRKKTQPLFQILPQILSILLLTALTISILALAGCEAGSAVLTEKDNGKNQELKAGDTITIKLQSNPTTGYSWFISDETDQSIISLISSEYKQSSSDKELVGGGGFETFKFKAASQGTTEIILNYMRPWEEDIEPVDVFRVSLNVK